MELIRLRRGAGGKPGPNRLEGQVSGRKLVRNRKTPMFLHPLATIIAAVVLVYPARAESPPPIRSIEIDDSGYRRIFEVSLDEIYIRSATGEERVVRTPFQPNGPTHLRLARDVPQGDGDEMELVLYEKDTPRNDSTRRVLTKKVCVRLKPGTDAEGIAHRAGAFAVEKLDYALGCFLFAAKETGGALVMAVTLRKMSGVASAEPLLGRRLAKKTLPTDRLFPNQWHLLNTGQSRGKPGIDLNVIGVWDTYRGRGVTVAIVDDGLQMTHPDLAPNVAGSFHYDYRDGDSDPSPSGTDDYHGTAVAGVAAARGDNSLGIAGVAFEATLVGVRLVGGIAQTDQQSADALLHSNQVVQISNNSWGAEDNGRTLDGPGPLAKLARENAVRTGRGGKGTVFVWAAGNGGEVQDNLNYDGYVNSMYVIPVASIDDHGKHADYSEPGACLVVVAPCNSARGAVQEREGVTTTDLIGDDGLNGSGVSDDIADTSYTRFFERTSAAAPMASGVIALMLEANPNLGWRDVKEILIRSATQTDPFDSDWIINGAGQRFNPKYGAGLLNAAAAVKLATNWANLGPQARLVQEHTNVSYAIPDNDAGGIALSFDFRKFPALRVEHAVVTATILHPRRGQMAITLVSPQGTRSRLAELRPDINADFKGWKFSSVVNWGESSQGEWKLHVADLRAFDVGTVTEVRLELYGTDAPQQTQPWLTLLGFEGGQFKFQLHTEPGYRYEIQTSTNMSEWTVVATTRAESGDLFEYKDNGMSNVLQRFFRALRTPLPP